MKLLCRINVKVQYEVRYLLSYLGGGGIFFLGGEGGGVNSKKFQITLLFQMFICTFHVHFVCHEIKLRYNIVSFLSLTSIIQIIWMPFVFFSLLYIQHSWFKYISRNGRNDIPVNVSIKTDTPFKNTDYTKSVKLHGGRNRV